MAIDGKTLCGSFDAFHDRKAAHVLSAFATDGQIILGHLAISQKSNEIPAAQDMIATLGLSGRLFTLDAMHCQKNIRNCPRHGQPSVGSTEGEPGQCVGRYRMAFLRKDRRSRHPPHLAALCRHRHVERTR